MATTRMMTLYSIKQLVLLKTKYLPVWMLAALLPVSGLQAADGQPSEEESTTENDAGTTPPAAGQPHFETLDSTTNRVSYSIGVNLGRNLKYNYPDTNLEFIIIGLRDVFEGKQLAMDEDAINQGINEYNIVSRKVAQERLARIGDENLEQGRKFLEEKSKEEGVVTLPSGLRYKVLHEGSGPSPSLTNNVMVQYHGKLISGEVFDSTYVPTKKDAMEIELKKTIKGWQEALPKMKLGGRWELYVPPDLAYGESGARGIPPNATLIFMVELVGMH